MKKYNFVYKTTNDLNDDYYYGVHTTDDLDDGYLGSGRRITRSVNKYGESSFTREIVQYFSDVNNAYRLEAAIVTNELIQDPHCLNIALGGNGGNTYAGFSDEELKEIGQKISKATSGKKRGPFSEEHKQNLRGPKSEEHKQKLRGPKSEEHKQKLRLNHADQSGKNNPMYGKNAEDYMTQEAIKEKRRKQSEGLRNYYKDPLRRSKCGDSARGKKCVNNGNINKLVYPYELDIYLGNGWKLGRLMSTK